MAIPLKPMNSPFSPGFSPRRSSASQPSSTGNTAFDDLYRCYAEATMDTVSDGPTTRDATAVADVPLRIREVGMEQLDLIRRLNVAVFDEEHIINTFDRENLLMLVAWSAGTPVGFKVGYQLDATTFYSAKGGVRDAYRRNGIARALLYAMIDVVEAQGYERFVYDTFPNKHPGMTVLGLDEGFRVVRAGYSPKYQDYRLRFAFRLDDAEASAGASVPERRA